MGYSNHVYHHIEKTNVRAASVLGIVGAGGIGVSLYLKAFSL
ncbi:hypothetical protein [Pleurocapsa sp. PCC 7319]|nr:hypothetical protein [Pleurocapsa sp. PCC 7319]